MRQPVRCEERNRPQRADRRDGSGAVALRAPGVLERKVRQADLKAVGELRGEICELLGRWAPPDGGAPADPEVAALLTSELVTNALLHTDGGAVVTARVTDRLRVEVRDGAERRPEPRAPSVDGTSGRGLMLVRALADAWGIRPEGGGKCVWFELGGGPA
ncbi:ATP-binding protein [Streptomyces sp. MspMP-M5]|uniref:ATP-binding protein n=1 Tax=Streptomyces sp. MspMP-M5 TaxID=1155718 RepID=UPI001F409EAF|nr:ATP-binding protein [Streptomyces sp. SID8354]